MNNLVTAGTITGELEELYVVDAVKNLSNPDHFNDYHDRFAKEFAEYIDVKYALPVSNGTSALHLGLLALGVGQGDEVILPDMTYIACANVIDYCGATPVFADIDPISWCLDPVSVKAKITKNTKAIMPVWMYGNVPDIHALQEFGIPIVEDSCPAIGSYLWSKHAGTIGDVGAFSFQGAKLLAIGEGGMLVTNNEKIYERAKKLADHSETDKQFWHDEKGYMYLMGNIQAALGLGQLHHIEELLAKKKNIFEWYKYELGDEVQMNEEINGAVQNYWMSSLVTANPQERDDLRKYLKEEKIDTRPFFYPITEFGVYKGETQPMAKEISHRGINLPSATYLTLPDIEYATSKIRAYYETDY